MSKQVTNSLLNLTGIFLSYKRNMKYENYFNRYYLLHSTKACQGHKVKNIWDGVITSSKKRYNAKKDVKFYEFQKA